MTDPDVLHAAIAEALANGGPVADEEGAADDVMAVLYRLGVLPLPPEEVLPCPHDPQGQHFPGCGCDDSDAYD